MSIKHLYLAGYNSSGSTLDALKNYYPNIEQLSYDPLKPLDFMVDISKLRILEDRVVVIASSLGGWFAERLASFGLNKPVDLVLYNPSINAEISLKKYGISDTILKQYSALKGELYLNCQRIVITSLDDNIVNSYDVQKYYKGVGKIWLTRGGHRMTDNNMVLIVDAVKTINSHDYIEKL